MNVILRSAKAGDERDLAYVQCESWKEAFKDILDAETLASRTDLSRCEAGYKRTLDEGRGQGYILFLGDKAHGICWWDEARDEEFKGMAEVILIHSLPEHRRQGYGRMMMERALGDIKRAGYKSAMLWVFTKNLNARKFYERMGFKPSDMVKPRLGTEEIAYTIEL